jgi:hypothetical protein
LKSGWQDIENSEKYRGLSNEEKMRVGANYFKNVFEPAEKFKALDKRKQDTVKKNFYDKVTATLDVADEPKTWMGRGLERIAEVETEAMRGPAARGESIATQLATPVKAATQLAGEAVGMDVHDPTTRLEAEAMLSKGEYGKYGMAAAGNIVKGMAQVPEILATAPMHVAESLGKAAGEATAPAMPEEARGEKVAEAAKGLGTELFGWIGDIMDDPIKVAFERPQDVAFAIELGKAGYKGGKKVVQKAREKVAQKKLTAEKIAKEKAEAAGVKLIDEAKVAEVSKGDKPITELNEAEVKSLIEAMPEVTTEAGMVKTPNIEHVAQSASWIKNKANNVYKTVKEFMVPLSTIKDSTKFLEMRYKNLGDLDRIEGMTKKFNTRLKEFSPEVNKQVFKYLDGQIDISKLPESARSVAQSLKTSTNLAWKGYLERGIIDTKTYAKNKGNYVKYMYLRHILGDEAPIVASSAGKLDLSNLKARKDLTDAQRKALGWVEDASIAGPVGLSQSLGNLAQYDFYRKISENPNWVWEPSVAKVDTGMKNAKGETIVKKMGIEELSKEVDIAKRVHKAAPEVVEAKARYETLNKQLESIKEGAGRAPKDYVQMPTSEKYGPLSGAYVLKPIAQDVKPLITAIGTGLMGSKVLAGAIKANQKLMSAFKVGKVALNPPTAFRNVISNMVQLNMSGIPLPKVPYYLIEGLKEIKKKGKDWKAAQKNGVFRTNWGKAEIREILGDLEGLEKQSHLNVFQKLNKVASLYGKIDDFFKMAKFLEQRRNGVAPSKAAIEAHKWGMDYGRVDPTIKAARANIAPFLTYQYKVMPLIAETVAKRPWVLAKYAMIPYLATQAFMKTQNLTEEEFDELKEELPLYIKNSGTSMVLPWRSPEGNAQWINFEYFMPFGNAWQTAQDIGKLGETSIEEVGPGEILGDIGISNPLADIVYASFVTSKGGEPPRDSFTGREIYSRLDDPDTKLQKTMYWLYTKFAPGAFTKEGAAGYTARIGEEDRYGRTITPEQAIGRWFGLNITAPTPEQAFKFKKYVQSELDKARARTMKDITLSEDEKEEHMRNYNKLREELWQ